MKIIKKTYDEQNELLLVDDIFEKMNVSDVYSHGQKVSCSDAGDYVSIDKDFSVGEGDEKLELKSGQIVSAYDDNELYQKIWDRTKGESDEYVCFENEKCTGYTYWDGHNHNTITVSVENGEPTHEICEGEEFEKMISEYDTAEKIKDVPGGEVWKSENFIYQKSFWQGHFEIASVETVEDYNFRISDYANQI